MSIRKTVRCLVLGSLVSSLLVYEAHAADQAAPRPAWKTSRIQGSPYTPEPYRIVPAYPKLRFERPTSIEQVPGESRLLVTEMGGRIFSIEQKSGADKADLVVDLKSILPAELAGKNVSLFDAEFHPNFAENRFLFVCYVHPEGGGKTRVSRLTLSKQLPLRAVEGSERVIITWPSGGHNGGCLEFGRDGMLYISTGDGSGPNPPDGLTTGQTVSDLLGAILRIDVDHATDSRAYAIPSDNPFRETEGARGEIWSYGLRNPWKFGVDLQTGDAFVADNGWESWEMIHRITRGANHGWPVMEGRASLRSEVAVGPTPILPPVKDHPHTEANSVIGGPVYRGSKLPELRGSFIYGDYIMGTIWAIRGGDGENGYAHSTLVDTDLRIVAFTQTSRDELLVLDYDYTGQIYEIVPSDRRDTSASFPKRLSETGLFASLATMEPTPGVVPYSVQVERWTDGASAQRWIAVPGNAKVHLPANAREAGIYPEGTVLVKQLSLPLQASAANDKSGRSTTAAKQNEATPSDVAQNGQLVRLETQILHYEDGRWHPYTYLWDEAGKDAWLVDAGGATRPVRSEAVAADRSADRTWHANASNECKACHNAESRFVLGFVTNQLNRDVPTAAGKVNQLSLLAAQGVLDEPVKVAADDPLKLSAIHDEQATLESRARSYLHVNCSMCHQPGGNAIVSFFLRRDMPFEQLNTNKGTGIGTFGIQNAKIIAPGDPYRSILVYRMSKLGYARMPYIGSRVVDPAGISLVTQWIESLPREQQANAAPPSPPLASDSPAATSLKLLTSNRASEKDQRQAAIRDLLQSTETSLALISRMHRGEMQTEDLKFASVQGSSVTRGDIRGLFETFVPESQRRATLGDRIEPRTILDRQGDVQRGKLIFFSDAGRCRACHEADDRTKSLGPTLREINKKYPKIEEMLEHVLEPSKKIDESFAAFSITTQDGQALSGLIVESTPEEVVVRNAEKQTTRLKRSSIDEMSRSGKSLMPERILSDLTAQEAADLLAYIRTLQP